MSMSTLLITQVMTDGDWLRLGRRLGIPPRQVQVARMVIEQEATADAIALALGITAGSVNTHLERLYKALGVRTRVGLAVRVLSEYVKMREESAAAGREARPLMNDPARSRPQPSY